MEDFLKVLAPVADNLNMMIVDAKLISNDLLELTIRAKDTPRVHVDLETCARVASAFAEALDYEIGLDVSSEGAERVVLPPEYEDEIGSYVHLTLKNPEQGFDQVEGELVTVSENSVAIQYRFKHTHKTIEIERTNIKLLRLAVKF